MRHSFGPRLPGVFGVAFVLSYGDVSAVIEETQQRRRVWVRTRLAHKIHVTRVTQDISLLYESYTPRKSPVRSECAEKIASTTTSSSEVYAVGPS